MTPSSSIVYAVETGLGHVKIGTTTDLGQRLKDLSAGSPVPLRLLGTIPGGRSLEASLHRQFAHRRSHGEWFLLTPEDLKALQARLEGEPLIIRLPYRKRDQTNNRFRRRR